MKKIEQIIYFCLINYVVTFPDELFDELWQTNQLEPQTNNNPIEFQPKIKVESNEEQFDGRWQDKSALKGVIKVEHEPHYGAVKVEGKDKIKHEFEWWGEENAEFKEQLEDNVKEEDQHGQAPNTFDHKKIGDNSNKHLSDQNNSTDQDESVDEQQNESNECEKIESDQHKLKIIQKFREMKEDYTKNRKYSSYQHNQIDRKIATSLSVSRSTIYRWMKELGLSQETLKFSELEKRQILKQFDVIKSKCKQAKLKISMNKLDKKIANKLIVNRNTIFKWKREFGLSVSNKKISDLEKREILKQFDAIKSKCKQAKLKSGSNNELDEKIAKKIGICSSTIRKWKRKFGLSIRRNYETKIEILKKYIKIKRKNPKMSDCDIADLLKISTRSIKRWKVQFGEENEYECTKL